MHLITTSPYRSLAGALILVIFFGPVGLYYASLIGGFVMTLLTLVAVGMVVAQQSPLPMVTIWLLSVIWAMSSVRWYNYRLHQQIMCVLTGPKSPTEQPKILSNAMSIDADD